MAKEEFKHIIRIANTDLDGNKGIAQALRKIKGIDFMFANMVCQFAKIELNKKAGYLSDEEGSRIESVIKNPQKYGAPSWMLNRRNDYEDGEDKHLLFADIRFVQDNDIKRMKMTKSYKGLRHQAGLTVRGQRTRSNFRRNKGKGSLGVKRRAGAKSGRT